MFGQHQVGCSGQRFVVEFVAKPVCVEELADGQFGFGVLASDTYIRADASVVAALSGCVYVGHEKR